MLQWNGVNGGDGAYTAINPDNPDIMYVSSQNGNMRRLQLSTGSSRGITSGIDAAERRAFIAPFVIDPQRPTRLYFGGVRMYRTTNEGTNWTAKGFPGSGAGVVHDIFFSSTAVGYLAHATATPAGRILRTYDGGYSWNILPEGTGTIPANDRINAVVGCIFDMNFVVGVGLADNATDGIIIKGSD